MHVNLIPSPSRGSPPIGEENEDISSLISLPELSNENSQLDLVDQINEQEKLEEVELNITSSEEIPESPDENSLQSSANVEYIKMPRLSDTMEEGTIS